MWPHGCPGSSLQREGDGPWSGPLPWFNREACLLFGRFWGIAGCGLQEPRRQTGPTQRCGLGLGPAAPGPPTLRAHVPAVSAPGACPQPREGLHGTTDTAEPGGAAGHGCWLPPQRAQSSVGPRGPEPGGAVVSRVPLVSPQPPPPPQATFPAGPPLRDRGRQPERWVLREEGGRVAVGMDILNVLLPRAAPGSPHVSRRVAPRPAPVTAASTSRGKPSTKLLPASGRGNGGVPGWALPGPWRAPRAQGTRRQRPRPASASLGLSQLRGGRASRGLGWSWGSVVSTGQQEGAGLTCTLRVPAGLQALPARPATSPHTILGRGESAARLLAAGSPGCAVALSALLSQEWGLGGPWAARAVQPCCWGASPGPGQGPPTAGLCDRA